jgi:Flp pilus assembly protein TadD
LLLLHAQVLSKLDRKDQAEQEYRQLLSSAFGGEARHGLGLLYASKNHAVSLQYLRQAAQLRPTDPDIRNDYGYALLTGGQYPAARLQLATAYELDSAVDKYRNNYLLALLILNDETEIERVRRRSEISDKVMQNLRAQVKGWPAVVKRTTAATATVAAPASARAAPKSTAERSNEVKKRLGAPGAN